MHQIDIKYLLCFVEWSIVRYVTIRHQPTPTISTNQTTHSHQNRLVVFSSLAGGISHFFTNTQNTQPREWKGKKNNHGLGLAPSARSRWHFCAALRAFAGYCGRVFVRNFHKATMNADLSSRVGQPGICRSTGPSSRLSDFCWRVSTLPWSHLWTDLFCRLVSVASFNWLRPSAFSRAFLPSSTSDLMGDLARKPFVSHIYDEFHLEKNIVGYLNSSYILNDKYSKLRLKYELEYYWWPRVTTIYIWSGQRCK